MAPQPDEWSMPPAGTRPAAVGEVLIDLVENISDGFAALDRAWRFTHVNRTFLKLIAPLHGSPQALIGEELWTRFPDIAGTPLERFYREAMAADGARSLDQYHAPRDAWLELRAFPTPHGLTLHVRDITERKRNEEKLAALGRQIASQAQLFEAILSNLTDLAYALDRDLRFLYANKPLLAILGRTADQVVGRNLSELNYPPELAHRLNSDLRQVLTTGRTVRGEVAFTDAAGREDYHEYIYTPAFSPDGQVTAVVGTTRLTTGRKRAEALNEAQRRVLQRIAEDAPTEQALEELARMIEIASCAGALVSIQVVDREGRRLRHGAAPSLPAAFTAAMDGREIGAGGGPAGRAALARRAVEVADLAAEGAGREERELAAAQGLRACRAQPILSSHGAVLGVIAVYYPSACEPSVEEARVLETAARTAAVAVERRRAEIALRESEGQLRLVTDHASVLLVHIDQQHRFRYVNRAYSERYGVSPESLTGKPARELIGEAAYAVLRPHLERALTGQRVELEIEVPYATLGRRWVHVVYVPERTAEGAVVGVVAVLTDVTTRKQGELEVARARDEALAASHAKDDFLATLSHELRTPLSPVLLLASDGAGDASLPPDVRRNFEMIARSALLEARLIDDLLDLTRIARGKMPLHIRILDIHSVLEEALATLRAELDPKSARIGLQLAAGRPQVRGDAARLQQVFWNVLKNAVKFTPPGGVVTVVTRTPAVEDVVEIVVADNGIGMTAEELKRAFDSFAQGDHAGRGGSHRFGGLGLGLAISRMLVELHGGTIRAESRGRGEGATIVIRLPRAAPAPPGPVPVETGRTAAAGGAAANGFRLLLVEDHEPTRIALTRLLSARRYHVVSAANVAQGLVAAEVGRFDLVVSDIGLPDGDGYLLMSTLRSRYGLRGIALTGYGMEGDVARSREAGFIAHLTKPVAVGTLEAALTAARAQAG